MDQPKVLKNDTSTIIAIRDKSQNLIYLLNEKGELGKNPFFGTTDFSIVNSNDQNKINLIIGSYEGVVYNYKIN